MSTRTGDANGAVDFARFAYPPNELGLCGPADHAELLEATAAGDAATLQHLARRFEGAWPYLELIAAANGIPDPLDRRVVTAYWIGGPLLARVPAAVLGNSLDDRFRARSGRHLHALVAGLEHGARPHHNFHVLCVYPWVGLLRHGDSGQPLRVLDQCRIRWGRVAEVSADTAVVTTPELRWDGAALHLGGDRAQTATWRSRGHGIAAAPRPGQQVALHWDWVVRPIDAREVSWLRLETERHLAIANLHLAAQHAALA